MSSRVKFSTGEEVTTTDHNDSQSLRERYINDTLLKRILLNNTTACFFGTDCKVVTTSGMGIQIGTGTGFHYVSTESDPDEPMFKEINVPSAQAITVSASDPANPRIDIVCIKADRANAQPENRYVMDGGGIITNTSVNKRSNASYAHQYVVGTPAGSPSAPAVPSGYVKIATIAVGAGVSSITQANITDERLLFLIDQTFLGRPYTITGSVHGKSDLTTSNATPAVVGSVSVAEGEVWSIEATVIGRKSDGTDRSISVLRGLFYRNTAGNVTQQGVTQIVLEEKSDSTWGTGTPPVMADLIANTSAQSVDVQVAGKAATSINWKVQIRGMKVS